MAVKQLFTRRKNAAASEFIREIVMLSTISHPNIVELLGASCDNEDGNRCLLYELMEGGSLGDRLLQDVRAVAQAGIAAARAAAGALHSRLESAMTSTFMTSSLEGDLAMLQTPMYDYQEFISFPWQQRICVLLDACLGLACLHECTLLVSSFRHSLDMLTHASQKRSLMHAMLAALRYQARKCAYPRSSSHSDQPPKLQ